MGMELSTARVVAPLAFLFDFVMQQYGMNIAKPNMLDIHNKYPAAFSPYAYAIPAFFGPQQIIQLVWLYRLCFAKDASAEELGAATDFAPYYALGNICIGLWLPFWNAENMWAAQACVTVNSLAQLYFYYYKSSSSPAAKWTRWNVTTFAGIGVLDFLHNGGIALFPRTPPSPLVKLLTPVFFGALALTSDKLMGACLAYDLAAIALGAWKFGIDGREGNWPVLLAGYSVATLGLSLWANRKTGRVAL